MDNPIPAGYRFSTVSPDDHGGLIYIAAFLTFTYSNITILARCGIKWAVFGFDDWAMCVAQFFSILQFAFLLLSLSAGLGENSSLLPDNDYQRMASMLYGNQITLYIALGLSKCAAVLLVQRLFTRDARKFWMICNHVAGVMIVWTILAIFMVSVGCSPTSTAPTTEAQICPGIFTRYQVLVITDCLSDIILVIVPAYLVWQLQMSTSLKLQVITVFAIRLPLLPLSILSLTNYNRFLHSPNPGVDRTPAIIFQQSELCFSLIAGTVPCLKAFIRSFDTGSGVKAAYNPYAYGSTGAYGRKESYVMRSLSGNASALRSYHDETGEIKINSKRFDDDGQGHGMSLGKHKVDVTSTVFSSNAQKDEDAVSHGSQELFIRRDVQWEVRSESVG